MIFGRDRITLLRQRVDAAMSDLLTLHAVERVNSARLDNLSQRVNDAEDAVATLRRTLDARTEQQV